MRSPFLAAFVFIVCAALVPFLGQGYLWFLLCSAAVYFIVALSLNILIGIAGQISIGHAAFWALGAYSSAVVVTKLGLPFLAGIAAAGIVAGLVGVLVALPALRIQGHYLAIATLAFALFVQQVLHEWESVTGGRAGIFVPRPQILGFELGDDRQYFYLLLALCAGLAWITWNLARSRTGRALMALRMSPTAAQCCGVDRRTSIVIAFGLSAALTGVSGGLYAHLVGYLSVSSFSLGTSLSFLTMVVIGGTSRIAGAVLGALFLTLAPEMMRGLGDGQMVIYGLILILVVMFLPSGLVGVPAQLGRLLRRSKKLPSSEVSS